MTINILNTLELKQFEAEVHQVFQEKGNVLRGACRFRNIKGNQDQFPVLGRLQAAERIVGTPLITSNQTATAVVISTTKFSVSQYTDLFLAGEVNFDAKAEAAQSVAMAMGRKMDQIIIDALDVPSYTKTVATNVSGSADDLTLDALRSARKQLDLDGVPEEDLVAVVHVNGKHHLTENTQVTSSDFNTMEGILNKGKLNGYYGFDMIAIGNNGDENGVPITGNVRKNWFYNKKAIGCVMGMDFRIEVNYVPEMGAHLVTGFFSAGSKVIDETGIVEVSTDES